MRIAVMGLGQRGYSVLVSNFIKFHDVDVVAVCDLYPDRVERAVNAVKAAKRKCRPYKVILFDQRRF